MTDSCGKVYGVFDIGSNSVRALVASGGKTLFKELITTRLGEGLCENGYLNGEAKDRTIRGITALLSRVITYRPDEIFAFATEAVRSASNGKEFTEEVEKRTGINVEIISGEEEGEIGLAGALGGEDGGIIDIGGASAEIAVRKNGKTAYCHSLPLGAVRLKDLCGEDEENLKRLIDGKIGEYGEIPESVDFYAVGGTATSLCACFLGLDKYDAEKVNGTVMSYGQVLGTYDKIKSLDAEERVKKLKISEKRADIIVGGVYLLARIMSEFDIKKITVSENDNMLGFLIKRGLLND